MAKRWTKEDVAAKLAQRAADGDRNAAVLLRTGWGGPANRAAAKAAARNEVAGRLRAFNKRVVAALPKELRADEAKRRDECFEDEVDTWTARVMRETR